ncbi:MAG: UPF0280 family protein [Desulfosalsimonadaceae bacterium]|nr:UPF0280 family protein [Desulfosalsimonadaceae bacterium]
MYEARSYRRFIKKDHLVSFQVTVKETDLWICATRLLADEAKEVVLTVRGYLESYIEMYPQFLKTLVPWRVAGPAPLIVKEMAEAGALAGVGPMAAVAGAVAAAVGRELMAYSDEVIVENGGDIFIKLNHPFTCAVSAGKSPLNMRFGIRLDATERPIGVCTSSATVGHSLSFGKADAVCVVSPSCAVADAAATAICNRVGTEKEIAQAINAGKLIDGVSAIVVIVNDKVGFWGDTELVPL